MTPGGRLARYFLKHRTGHLGLPGSAYIAPRRFSLFWLFGCLWFFVSGLNDKLTYSFPASSTFMENEEAVSSLVPSLARLAKQSWRSNQTLETRPNGLSGERAVDSRSNFRSASVTCGWCFALSWPFFRCVFSIDLNTLLLVVNSKSAYKLNLEK